MRTGLTKMERKAYRCWTNIRQRCTNKNKPDYSYYGGRGITVCRRWSSFDKFLADMGEPPTSHHTIERKNNDGNYEPSNCCWASRQAQSYNRPYCKVKGSDLATVYRLYDVEKKSQQQIANRFGVTQAEISHLLRKRSTHTKRRNDVSNNYRLRKITYEQREQIDKLYAAGHSQKEIAVRFGIIQCHVSRILRRRGHTLGS